MLLIHKFVLLYVPAHFDVYICTWIWFEKSIWDNFDKVWWFVFYVSLVQIDNTYLRVEAI